MPGKQETKESGSSGVRSDSRGLSVNLAGLPVPLRRTFGALDRLLALPIEAVGDALEKKLKGNVESHVDAVQKKRVRKGKKEKIVDLSPKTAKEMGEWATAAAEVDPDDKDLSAAPGARNGCLRRFRIRSPRIGAGGMVGDRNVG
jgi:hypothetical protein